MTWLVFLLPLLVSCAKERNFDSRVVEERNHRLEREDLDETERTWKISKKGFGYAIIGLMLKALLWIKLALGKLAILGNISIMLSKLSLILSLFLTLSKYFGGISKMLKLKPLGYDGHSIYHYPGHEHQPSYAT